MIVPRLCGYCGRAVCSVILVFSQLHRSSFNLGLGLGRGLIREGGLKEKGLSRAFTVFV